MHGLFHFAYLDAGTGSLIIQSLIGVFAGIAVFGRRVIAKVTHSIFRRGKNTPEPANPATDKQASKSK